MRNNLSDLIETYISYLKHTKNASPKTIENYSLWLNRFLVHTGDISVEEISSFLVLSYRQYLEKLDLSMKTINYHIVALRAFLKFLHRHDIDCISPDKLELAKVPPRTVNFLGDDEIKKILNAPNQREKNDLKRLRDLAILNVLYGSGLRVSELINLKLKDIKFDSNQFRVIGKGSKLRSVFMTKAAKQFLEEYINMRGNSGEYLFQSLSKNSPRGNLTRVSVENLVRTYAAYCNINKKVTPHTLRHSFATSLLMKGADIRSVQMLLGHSSITTTQIYTHVADKHLQKVHDLLDEVD